MHSGIIAERRISISALKKLALEELPMGLLRDDILSQPEELAPEEFLANARMWLRLARAR